MDIDIDVGDVDIDVNLDKENDLPRYFDHSHKASVVGACQREHDLIEIAK